MTLQTLYPAILITALQGGHYSCGNNIPDGETEAERLRAPQGQKTKLQGST